MKHGEAVTPFYSHLLGTMTLLRVGQLTINLAQVTLNRDLDAPATHRGGLRVEFAGGQGIDVVKQADADFVRVWLQSSSEDVSQPG
jgi:hypothetical protein